MIAAARKPRLGDRVIPTNHVFSSLRRLRTPLSLSHSHAQTDLSKKPGIGSNPPTRRSGGAGGRNHPAQVVPMTASAALPEVHLEVRQGAGRNARYALDHVDFLIGAVPGCDLRVPGADLPPVLCLIARQPGGARLRKLAPTQVLLVNGKTAANINLADGDRITLGALDIFVHITGAAGSAAAPVAEQAPAASPAPSAEEPRTTKAKQDLQKQMQAFRAQVLALQEERTTFAAERQRQQEELKQRQKQLDEQAAELDQRRAEIQKET